MPKNLLPTGKNFCIHYITVFGQRYYLTVRSDASGFAGRLLAYFMPSRVKWLFELVRTGDDGITGNYAIFQAVYNDDNEGTFSLFIPSKNAFVGNAFVGNVSFESGNDNDKTERPKFLLKSDENTRIGGNDYLLILKQPIP